MDPEYAARYAELHATHWWWRAREAFVLGVLERRRGAAGGRILDVGCGDGLLFGELSRLGEVEGVEPCPSMVTPDGPWSSRIAVRPFDETFRPGHHYGQVLFLDVLEHADDPASMLAHALELLEPGGFVLVTVPALPALWTRHDDLNRHRARYTRGSLDRLALAAGARVETARYFFHWLVPVKLAVRLKESVVPGEPSTPGIPPRPVNAALEHASRLEQATVSRLRLPFGASLLAVLVPGGTAT
jgi:2-polyprenyl-3-methyl-5-hydroxy-6-metoxy-1,4-benzoquinol methylase